MSTETLILVLLFFLSLVHYLLPAAWFIPLNGWAGLAGARDELQQPQSVTGQRAKRAQENFKETLPWAIGLLILVQVTGDDNAMTALGGWLYLAGRAIYLPVYVLGVPWVRSYVWLAAMFGLLLIVLQLF